jgi:hypothetical protein
MERLEYYLEHVQDDGAGTRLAGIEKSLWGWRMEGSRNKKLKLRVSVSGCIFGIFLVVEEKTLTERRKKCRNNIII